MRVKPFAWLRSLYDWVVGLANRPGGVWALFLIAFAESSFFPIPPDVLLLPLAIGAPARSLWFAAVSTAGSVLGAGLGYLLGLTFYEGIGRGIIQFYSVADQYEAVQSLYVEWDVLAVLAAGFTPIPFKLFTIAAGVFQIHFVTFMLAAAVGRGARFFLVGGMVWWFGAGIQRFVDRYFNLLSILFVLALVGGFLILKYVI